MTTLIDNAVTELIPIVGVRAACASVGMGQADWYRRHRQTPAPPRPKREPKPQPRALSDEERATVREVLNSPEHLDESPDTVYAKLLDEGTYLASPRTMYRILAEHDEVHERRRQATHPAKVKPELMADAPNRVWSWDITRIAGAAKWSWFYLYVIIDIFSRYVPGWMLATAENHTNAKILLGDTIRKQQIPKGQLRVHADNGGPMIAQPVGVLLAELGVTKSHSRPHCSNDNPFIESHFRTLKYRPEFPDRFGSFTDARQHCEQFFNWYNLTHRHSGIGYHTPHDVHHGHAQAIRAQRGRVLDAALHLTSRDRIRVLSSII